MSSSDSGKMTKSDAARIQSSQAKAGEDTGAGTFAARAQSAADRHVNEAHTGRTAQGAEAAAKDASKGKGPAVGNQGAGGYQGSASGGK